MRSGLALEQPAERQRPAARALIAEALGGVRRSRASRRHATVVVCAFGALIKEPLLSEHEILNVHPSLLPRWRGAAPIERAIMAGDARTGRLDHAPDGRPGQRPGVPDGASSRSAPTTTTARSPRACRSSAASCSCARSSERPPFAEQPEQGVTYAEKIAPSRPAARPRPAGASSSSAWCARCTRTSAPAWRWPTAACWACTRGAVDVVRAARARAEGAARRTRAGVFAHDGRLLLDCAPGVLELLEVQPPGGRAMDARRYLRGHGAGAPVGAVSVGRAGDAGAQPRVGLGRAGARSASGITPAHAGSA